MASKKKESWTLAELAVETGLSARTIRYYISRNLLPGPEMAGRGAVYRQEHLRRLQEIRRRQSRGAMLAEIDRVGEEPMSPTALPEPQTWEQYRLAEDVMVWVRTNVSPWRKKIVRRALGELTAAVQRKDKDDDHGKS